MSPLSDPHLAEPVLILAADHRPRGVVTVENYGGYLAAITAAMAVCDGLLASMQPLRDLVESKSIGPEKKTYLSLNRTGLAGSAFELDDRLVASVEAASELGAFGVKHMVRIDMSDPLTAPALELLGRVLEQARAARLDAMVEALSWREGKVARDTDSIVFAAVVAHDMGSPLLKVPVPLAAPGSERIEAVARVVQSVGVPVLFLGGPRPSGGAVGAPGRAAGREGAGEGDFRESILSEVSDAMDGGAAGLAIGRTVIEDPDPAQMASSVAAVLRRPR